MLFSELFRCWKLGFRKKNDRKRSIFERNLRKTFGRKMDFKRFFNEKPSFSRTKLRKLWFAENLGFSFEKKSLKMVFSSKSWSFSSLFFYQPPDFCQKFVKYGNFRPIMLFSDFSLEIKVNFWLIFNLKSWNFSQFSQKVVINVWNCDLAWKF